MGNCLRKLFTTACPFGRWRRVRRDDQLFQDWLNERRANPAIWLDEIVPLDTYLPPSGVAEQPIRHRGGKTH